MLFESFQTLAFSSHRHDFMSLSLLLFCNFFARVRALDVLTISSFIAFWLRGFLCVLHGFVRRCASIRSQNVDGKVKYVIDYRDIVSYKWLKKHLYDVLTHKLDCWDSVHVFEWSTHLLRIADILDNRSQRVKNQHAERELTFWPSILQYIEAIFRGRIRILRSDFQPQWLPTVEF